jgi:hypothetical protein
MFIDVSISTTLNNEFSKFIQSKEHVELGVNFSIMVLQVMVAREDAFWYRFDNSLFSEKLTVFPY